MQIRCLIAVVAAALLGSLPVQCEEPKGRRVNGGVTLYKDGAPVATIVTAAEPPATVELAVAELQHHMKRMFGTALPRATDAEEVAGPVILVGASARTAALGLSNDDFERQEFLVATRPDTLILMGRDRQVFGDLKYDNDLTLREKFGYVRHYNHPYKRFPLYPGWTKWDAIGTCYAVYEFLERFCGVRWYMPGENGMVAPEKKDLSVGPVQIRRKPWMIYREGTAYERPVPKRLYWWDRTEKITPGDVLPYRDTQLWVLRNKGWGSAFIANHSYVHWYKRFLEAHPDWFVSKPHPAWKRLGRELCLTHPEVRAQMLKDIDDYFSGMTQMPEHPGANFTAAGDYFSITPNDQSTKEDVCHCERCAPLLGYPEGREFAHEKDREFSYASRLVWGFIVDIAKELAKTHPDKYISALAYPFFLYPPPDMEKQDNLAVMVTLQPSCAFVYNPSFRESRERLIEEWRPYVGQLFVWLYSCYPQYGTGQRFPALIYNEFSRQMKYFHEQGIKGFFDDMDGRLNLTVEGLGGRTVSVWPNPMEDVFRHYTVLKMADDITWDVDKEYDAFYRNWYGNAADPIRDFVREAQRLHNDPDFVFNGVLQPQGYAPGRSVGKGWQEAIWGGVCTEEDLERLGGFIAAAYQAADTPQAKAHVALFDKAIYQGIVAGRSKWIPPGERKGLRKRAVCPRLPEDVSVTLADVPWEQAIDLSAFVPHKHRPVIAPDFHARARLEHPTEVRVIRDASTLYVRIRCLGGKPKGDDADTDDVVELFFDPDQTGAFYQILVYPDGKVREYSSKDKWKWQSHAEVAVEEEADAWVVLMAIPLRSLSDNTLRSALPQAGDMWRFNVTRSLRNWTVLSAWSPALGGWRDPEYFGELWFSVLGPDDGRATAPEKTTWTPVRIPDPRWRDGHSTWSAAETQASYSCDKNVKRPGREHSFHINNESETPSTALYLAHVPGVDHAARIKASAWVRTRNALVEMCIRFRDKDGAYMKGSVRGDRIEGTTDWTPIQVRAEAPEGAVGFDIFLVCKKGEAWFDGLTCVRSKE